MYIPFHSCERGARGVPCDTMFPKNVYNGPKWKSIAEFCVIMQPFSTNQCDTADAASMPELMDTCIDRFIICN